MTPPIPTTDYVLTELDAIAGNLDRAGYTVGLKYCEGRVYCWISGRDESAQAGGPTALAALKATRAKIGGGA